MIITVDTKHDSHEDIRKVISILRHLVGEGQLLANVEISPQPSADAKIPAAEADSFSHLFSEQPSANQPSAEAASSLPLAQSPQEQQKSGSDDLFSELFSEEDVPKGQNAAEEDEEEKK